MDKMINRAILEAQLELYRAGRERSLNTMEQAKADVNAFNGAIEACTNFLRILDEMNIPKPEEVEQTETTGG